MGITIKNYSIYSETHTNGRVFSLFTTSYPPSIPFAKCEGISFSPINKS